MNSTDTLLEAIVEVRLMDGDPRFNFARRHAAHLALNDLATIYRNRVEAHAREDAEHTTWSY